MPNPTVYFMTRAILLYFAAFTVLGGMIGGWRTWPRAGGRLEASVISRVVFGAIFGSAVFFVLAILIFLAFLALLYFGLSGSALS